MRRLGVGGGDDGAIFLPASGHFWPWGSRSMLMGMFVAVQDVVVVDALLVHAFV